MLPRTTRSTLFPYTTLFRSRINDGVGSRGNIDLFSVGLVYRFGRPPAPAPTPAVYTPPPPPPAPRAAPPPPPRVVDRKSTRLNSSHSQISYAVFCLKKKKKR